jgi:hypothetical protein
MHGQQNIKFDSTDFIVGQGQQHDAVRTISYTRAAVKIPMSFIHVRLKSLFKGVTIFTT